MAVDMGCSSGSQVGSSAKKVLNQHTDNLFGHNKIRFVLFYFSWRVVALLQ